MWAPCSTAPHETRGSRAEARDEARRETRAEGRAAGAPLEPGAFESATGGDDGPSNASEARRRSVRFDAGTSAAPCDVRRGRLAGRALASWFWLFWTLCLNCRVCAYPLLIRLNLIII